MLKKHKNVLKLFGGVLLFIAVFNLFGCQAQAATLTVTGGCTLPEAIDAVNAAADGAGCVKTEAAYGTSDTITLPAGTQTASADLPSFEVPIVVTGAGQSSTTINLNGNLGFNANFSNDDPNTQDITIENMKITGGDPRAVYIIGAKDVTLDKLEITDSMQVVFIQNTLNITVSNSYIHDNEDPTISYDSGQERFVGLTLSPKSFSADNSVSVAVTDTRVNNNTGQNAGIFMQPDQFVIDSNNAETIESISVTVRNTVVKDNKGEATAGIAIAQSSGPVATLAMDLDVSATTIANNEIEVTVPLAYQPGTPSVGAGMMMTGVLADIHHVTNVTVANNTVVNNEDDRFTFSGFNGALANSSTPMDIVNTTVVGNTVEQADQILGFPAFFVSKFTLNQSFQPTAAAPGSSATNALVLHNLTNGQILSCLDDAATADFVGIDLGVLDLTPINNGHNMTDDTNCTGYTYVANLYDTIEHEVADNGGPVPTIKLLPGSPAINGGGQVLGISTDARGVARTGYISVGAYQGVLLAATTDTPSGGSLAETGAVKISAIILLVILLVSLFIIIRDYRRHKKPLKAIDPNVSYSFMHHIRVVTVPLFRYRLSIKVSRINPLDKSGVHKF